MPGFWMNPFKSHDVDHSDVVVPIANAPRHPSVISTYDERRRSTVTGDPIARERDSKDKEDFTTGVDAERDAGGVDDPFTLEALRAEIDQDVSALGLDTVYDRKSKIINKAIQDIGMGPYNWKLFVLCGFGWFADNFWLQGLALTLIQLQVEFKVPDNKIPYTTCATFIGLCIGASFWGIMSDIIGRRIAFNSTLFIAGVFGLAVGGGNSWIAVCGLFAALGTGVGGNLPVDGALFLEFLPFASGGLLTLLSVWWPVGQLIASLIAWGFIPNYSCAPDATVCLKKDNMGWRYLTFTLGAITFIMFMCRFFFFHLYESPKFLLSRGRQKDAVGVVHGIAFKNKQKTWLTEEILDEIGGRSEVVGTEKLSIPQIIRKTLSTISTERLKPLFHTRKEALTTVLVWFCWTTIGMGYPLFNAFLPKYLANNGGGKPKPNSVVYRNYAITSIVGVPGSIIACYTVDMKYIGRKGTMAISTALSGIFLFLFTVSVDDKFQTAFASLEAFFQNIMYGVLYAYTPEVFPAPHRCTATGIASFLNRIAGLCAPIIAANTLTLSPKIPVYIGGALFLSAAIAMVFLPVETRGKHKL